MFGEFTNYLAILGICSLVFWLICFMKYLSKCSMSKTKQDVYNVLCFVLSVVSLLPSLFFAFPVQLLCKEYERKGYSEGMNKQYEISQSILKSSTRKAYDNGLEYGLSCSNHRANMFYIELHWLFDCYRGMYDDYKEGIPFSDVKDEYTNPDHFFRDDIPE